MLRRTAFAFAIASLIATGAVAGESRTAVRTTMKTDASRVEAQTTALEVDVMGTFVVGVLQQTYVNDGSTPLQMRFDAAMPSGLRSQGIEVEIDGTPVETPKPEATARGRNTRPSRAPSKDVGFALESGATATVRALFGATVGFDDGRYVLELPSVDAGMDGGDPWPLHASVVVRVHHDEPLIVAESPSHEIMVSYEGTSSRVEPIGGLAERTFRLEYAVGRPDGEPDLTGFVGSEDASGLREVMMVLSPPIEPPSETVRPKQVLFVVDASGSMLKDDKLSEAVSAVELCLERLGENDELNVARFANEFELMSEESIPADAEGLTLASTWLANMRRGGGTKLLGALGATLQQPDRTELHRMIIVITDGNIQDEQPVLQLLKSNLGEGRLFVVGIGADMKKDTLVRLAEFGRGTAAFVTNAADLQESIMRLFGSVSQPLAWNLTVEAGGVEVVSVEPARLPDLYAGRPVAVRAKVRGGIPGEIAVSGETMNGSMRFTTRPVTDAAVRALERSR